MKNKDMLCHFKVTNKRYKSIKHEKQKPESGHKPLFSNAKNHKRTPAFQAGKTMNFLLIHNHI